MTQCVVLGAARRTSAAKNDALVRLALWLARRRWRLFQPAEPLFDLSELFFEDEQVLELVAEQLLGGQFTSGPLVA